MKITSDAHKRDSKAMVLPNNKSFMAEFELGLCYSGGPHGLSFSEAFMYLMKILVMVLSL